MLKSLTKNCLWNNGEKNCLNILAQIQWKTTKNFCDFSHIIFSPLVCCSIFMFIAPFWRTKNIMQTTLVLIELQNLFFCLSCFIHLKWLCLQVIQCRRQDAVIKKIIISASFWNENGGFGSWRVLLIYSVIYFKFLCYRSVRLCVRDTSEIHTFATISSFPLVIIFTLAEFFTIAVLLELWS